MTGSADRSDSGGENDVFDVLLAKARDGDADAIGKILEQCQKYLLLIANQGLDENLQRKIGASDLVQESMLTAQAQFQDFRGQTRQQFLGWMRGILLNDVRHWRRHYKGTQKRGVQNEADIGGAAQAGFDPADSMLTPSTSAATDEEEAILQRAIQTLPDNYQEVINLRSWQDKSFSDIGEQLDCTPDAARKLWSRAILRLEKVLADELPEMNPESSDFKEG